MMGHARRSSTTPPLAAGLARWDNPQFDKFLEQRETGSRLLCRPFTHEVRGPPWPRSTISPANRHRFSPLLPNVLFPEALSPPASWVSWLFRGATLRQVPSRRLPNRISYARASRIILNGVSAARRTRVNPPFERTSLKRRSPACAPRARPTS
jgi:hypothetical protein